MCLFFRMHMYLISYSFAQVARYTSPYLTLDYAYNTSRAKRADDKKMNLFSLANFIAESDYPIS